MTYEDIIVTQKNGVAVVTLNRPEVLNALSVAMREAIGSAFEAFQDDDAVRAVVITGAGRAFCAGGDIKSFDQLSDSDSRQKIFRLMRRALNAITGLEKPVIAMVNGAAAGAGCNIALSCDIIIASEKAIFSEAFVRIGLAPDWAGAYFLSRMVGVHRAKEIAFTGMRMDAGEAERIGLINHVVPHEQLESRTMELAEQLAKSPTKAIGSIKQLIQKASLMDMSSLLDYEAYVQYQLLETHDHKEGVKAFLEKREPEFKGK
jgi:2-(1,2-epoxy-1,2-dihydrophenyl)acetyl-CoA isomerase